MEGASLAQLVRYAVRSTYYSTCNIKVRLGITETGIGEAQVHWSSDGDEGNEELL